VDISKLFIKTSKVTDNTLDKEGEELPPVGAMRFPYNKQEESETKNMSFRLRSQGLSEPVATIEKRKQVVPTGPPPADMTIIDQEIFGLPEAANFDAAIESQEFLQNDNIMIQDSKRPPHPHVHF
jgi:hypothetical protein